jgi:hypothetical protein
VNLPFNLPPWTLWTAAGLVGCAVLGLVGGARRGRKKSATPAAFSFEVLAAPIAALPGNPNVRPVKPPSIAPPAPLADSRPDGVEQRAHYRRPGNPVHTLVADDDQQRQPWNAWVVDRSRHGVRLAVERPMKIGNVYTVRPALAPPATPWTALEVRHCFEVNGHWEAGCRFLKPPAVAIMMLFG